MKRKICHNVPENRMGSVHNKDHRICANGRILFDEPFSGWRTQAHPNIAKRCVGLSGINWRQLTPIAAQQLANVYCSIGQNDLDRVSPLVHAAVSNWSTGSPEHHMPPRRSHHIQQHTSYYHVILTFNRVRRTAVHVVCVQHFPHGIYHKNRMGYNIYHWHVGTVNDGLRSSSFRER